MNIPVEGIVSRLEEYPEVVAAYLFGSAASGRMSDTSDIDIAVLAEWDHAGVIDQLELAVRISSVTGRETDIVILNRAEPLLVHEVLEAGRLILDRDPGSRISFEVYSAKRYEDYLYLHGIYMKGIRARHG